MKLDPFALDFLHGYFVWYTWTQRCPEKNKNKLNWFIIRNPFLIGFHIRNINRQTQKLTLLHNSRNQSQLWSQHVPATVPSHSKQSSLHCPCTVSEEEFSIGIPFHSSPSPVFVLCTNCRRRRHWLPEVCNKNNWALTNNKKVHYKVTFRTRSST